MVKCKHNKIPCKDNESMWIPNSKQKDSNELNNMKRKNHHMKISRFVLSSEFNLWMQRIVK